MRAEQNGKGVLNTVVYLNDTTEQYSRLIISSEFNNSEWEEKTSILSPIVAKLHEVVENEIAIGKKNIEDMNALQNTLIIERSIFYSNLSHEEKELSSLEIERVKITKEIELLSSEITDLEKKIEELKQKVEKQKKDKEYWDTVFWATCWLPFVNIGTGIKKDYETGQYEAQAKVYGEECQTKKETIARLTDQLKAVQLRQKKNEEGCVELKGKIKEIESQISEVTDKLNILKQKIGVWDDVYEICQEVEVQLRYVEGNIQAIDDCFKRLKKTAAYFSGDNYN